MNAKIVSQLSSSSSSSSKTLEVSPMSKSNGHCKESDYHDIKVVDKMREWSREESNKISKKYGFDQDLLWLIGDFKFDLDTHCKLKINELMHTYELHRE